MRPRLPRSRGMALLERALEERGLSYRDAARLIADKTGVKVMRVSIYHWVRGIHSPAARPTFLLEQALGIPIGSWFEADSRERLPPLPSAA